MGHKTNANQCHPFPTKHKKNTYAPWKNPGSPETRVSAIRARRRRGEGRGIARLRQRCASAPAETSAAGRGEGDHVGLRFV